jgi:hypothetical protein
MESENGHFVVNKFCRDYLASFLRTKIFLRSKMVSKKGYFITPETNFKYHSISDILFRFNVIFTLFLSKSFLPSGKFFFERSFRDLTSNLARLIIIYKFRNVAESFRGAGFFNEVLSLRLEKFLRKVGVYFVFFSQLQISKFFKCFFRFLSSAINRTFIGLDEVSSKLTFSKFVGSKSVLFAYKFKQL